jgi:RNA polymerase sigma-70 factor (ECF subfamily)
MGVENATAERLSIQVALQTLSPKYRVPLILYVCQECTVAEVADVLGLSISAVKMRLSRAREMLRRAYQQEDV